MRTGDSSSDPEKGEFVESGTFRVDVASMLETLSRYQFSSQKQVLFALVRCAVASGASAVEVKRLSRGAGAGFRLEFDGRLFRREELAEVFSPLLAGDPGRGKHLASAVLALLRTKPFFIRIFSAEAGVLFTGFSPRSVTPPRIERRTALEALWAKGSGESHFADILARPSDELALCPIPVLFPDGPADRLAGTEAPAGGFSFDEGGRRGIVILPDEANPAIPGASSREDSLLRVYNFGVLVENHYLRLPLLAVHARINDDNLLLDASLEGCVRDKRFSALVASLETRCEDLLRREISAQKKDLAEIGRLAEDRVYAALWRNCRQRGDAVTPPGWKDRLPDFLRNLLSFTSKTRPHECGFKNSCSRAFRLQKACLRNLKGVSTVPPEPALAVLWEAPVLLSTHGAVLSLEKTHLRVKDDRLAVSWQSRSERPGVKDAVWLASEGDRDFLNEWIPAGKWDFV